MSDKIDMLLEKFIAAKQSYIGYNEIFQNPTKRELRETANSSGELRFIADSKKKKMYVFPVNLHHSMAWGAIKDEIGDSRRMYADETLFGGTIEAGQVENWGFRDGLYKNEILAEWVLHPEIWKFASKWFDVMGWIERQEDILNKKGSGNNRYV